MFPILEGMHPWNLLFAKTTTETGELPRFSRKSNAKRLSFMKIRSLSNNSFETLPSNNSFETLPEVVLRLPLICWWSLCGKV
jgi:hypothetical protein